MKQRAGNAAAQARARARYAAYRAAGLCWGCGAALVNPTLSRCAACRQAKAATLARRKVARQEAA